jgi:hypothetical protein
LTLTLPRLPSHAMLFQTVQFFYWVGLSTWFGSAIFIAMAAPIIFRTVRENNPILSHVLSVNLDGQHSTLLADNIVFNLIQRLLLVELVCAVIVLLTLSVHPFVIDMAGNNKAMLTVRSLLFLAAAIVVSFDRQFVWPRIQSSRQTYLDHADEPEIANPARDRFDEQQRKSLSLLVVVVVLLAGIVLFSSSITPPPNVSYQMSPAAGK